VCVHSCASVCVCVRLRVFVYLRPTPAQTTHTHNYAGVHACAYKHTHTRARAQTHMHTHAHMLAYTHRARVHGYTHLQGDLTLAHRTLSVKPSGGQRHPDPAVAAMRYAYCACIRHQQWSG